MKLFLVVIIFLLNLNALIAQSTKIDSLLSERVLKLEKYEENLRASYEAKSEVLRLSHEKVKSDLEDNNKILTWLVVIFGPISISAILVTLFSLYFKARKYADESIKSSITKIVALEKDKIIKIIDSHDEEVLLKKNSSILVLSKSESEFEFQNFFDKIGFSKVQYKTVDDFKSINKLEEYDLIFFDNEDQYFKTKDDVYKYVIDNELQVYFILGPGIVDGLDKKRFNFANSRITLYSNLISTLKFQNILKNK